jgi:hypothetical protein
MVEAFSFGRVAERTSSRLRRTTKTQKLEFRYTPLLGKNDPLKFKVALYENIRDVF